MLLNQSERRKLGQSEANHEQRETNLNQSERRKLGQLKTKGNWLFNQSERRKLGQSTAKYEQFETNFYKIIIIWLQSKYMFICQFLLKFKL